MIKKDNVTREDARQVLRKGILDMSVERLIQMSKFGLAGNIELRNEIMLADNAFNHMDFHEENGVIQAGENGMTLLDLATYAGFEVHQISA